MSRFLFGGTDGDDVVSIYSLGGNQLRKAAPNVALTFWTDPTGGTQHTDILAAVWDDVNDVYTQGSAVSAVTSDNSGFWGPAWLPDGVTKAWAQAASSTTRYLVLTSQLDSTDAAVSAAIQTKGSATETALNTAFVGRAGYAGQPAKLVAPNLRVPTTNEPLPVGVIDGVLYGYANATLSKSTDNGTTWTTVTTAAPSGTNRIFATSDGEMIAVTATTLSKSSGWATSPATATWTTKITTYADAIFENFSVDGDGTKFIADEYDATTRANSRYVHISTDSGTTWNVVWDASVVYPSETGAHLHGCCYDPWEDRFWFGYAHGATTHGLFYSDDNGGTWTRLTGGLADGLVSVPTVYCATDDGIVCGADSDEPGGILGIRRATTPAAMELTISWQAHMAVVGSESQANMGWRDPTTGLVYVGFTTQVAGNPMMVVAGTASTGAKVWSGGSSTSGDGVRSVFVTSGGVLAAYAVDNTATKVLYGKTGRTGATVIDTGGVLGGTTNAPGAMAAGNGASATGNLSAAFGQGSTASAPNAVAVGPQSQATGSNSTAIGVTAHAAGNGTAIGNGAQATGTDQTTAVGSTASAAGARATAIGYAASAPQTLGLAIGASSTASGSNATALGFGASAGGNGTAVGTNAKATGTDQSSAFGEASQATNNYALALGCNAVSSGVGSVALGAGVTTTADHQVAIGASHVEYKKVATAPVAGAAGTGRLYIVDNGAGKMSLRVQFPTGAAITLATEA